MAQERRFTVVVIVACSADAALRCALIAGAVRDTYELVVARWLEDGHALFAGVTEVARNLTGLCGRAVEPVET